MERHGVCVYHGETFPDCDLRYPGDPNGEAAEVINCHCVLITDVLDDDQEIVDGKIVSVAVRPQKQAKQHQPM